MKLILSLFIYLLFFSIAYATDSEENIQIIELHNQTIDQIILEVNKNNNNQDNTNDIDISTPDTSVDNQIVEQEILSTSDSKSINDSDTNESVSSENSILIYGCGDNICHSNYENISSCPGDCTDD